jgi:class 3 adenylate cyclase
MPDYDLLMGAGPSMNRRLAAILAADITGYSRLMHEDETATVRDLKAHQSVVLPLFAQRGGRVIDTADDGILAECPSVVGATECAIEIQSVMAARNQTVASSDACAFASASTSASSDNATFRKEYQRIAEGVRKAGLPAR